MKVLVIGGTRFIGPPTVRRLVELGHEVTVFHRGTTEPADLPDVGHIHGDRADLETYRDQIATLSPDSVIDMMPLTRQDAETVVNTIIGLTPRVLAVSSQDVYASYGRFIGTQPGPIDPAPAVEAAPLRTELYPYRDRFAADHPMHDYDKIPAEQLYLSQFDLFGTVLRLPCVYGPNDAQRRLWPYLKRMLDGRPTILLSERKASWRWTRGYVENVADAIAMAATHRKSVGRVFNIGDPSALTEREWIEAIGRAASWAGQVRVLPEERMPAHLQSAENYEQPLVADTSRIRNELGYAELVDSTEAMRRAVAWESENPDESRTDYVFDYAAEDAALDER